MRLLCILLLALLPAVSFAGKATVLAVPPEEKARTDLATLVLPLTLDMQLVDGIAYPGFRSLGRKGELAVKVLPGEREIALKYSQLFEIGSDDHEVVRSKTMVLLFVAEPGKVYRAVHDDFRTLEAAHEGVRNFVVRVEDEAGVNRVVGATQTSRDWKGEETTTRRKDLVNPEVAATVAPPAVVAPSAPPVAAAPAMAASAPAAAPAATPQAAPQAAPAAGGGTLNALELLKFSWRNAPAADRAAFLDWAKANP